MSLRHRNYENWIFAKPIIIITSILNTELLVGIDYVLECIR